jgi:hypothetical protein
MYVCYKKYENKQKEWHPATKPFNFKMILKRSHFSRFPTFLNLAA